MAPAPAPNPASAAAMAAAFTARPDTDMLKRQATRVASFAVATFTFTQWSSRQPGRGAAGLAGSRYISNCSSKRAGELVVAPSGTPYLMPHTLCPCTPLPVPCRMPLRCFLCFSSQRHQIAHMTHRIFIRIALRPSAQEFFPVLVFLSLCSFHSSSSCSPSTSCCWPYDERSGVISIDCHAE